jgi:hypothetical protein
VACLRVVLQEEVLRLDVPVRHVAPVTVLHRQRYLATTTTTPRTTVR